MPRDSRRPKISGSSYKLGLRRPLINNSIIIDASNEKTATPQSRRVFISPMASSMLILCDLRIILMSSIPDDIYHKTKQSPTSQPKPAPTSAAKSDGFQGCGGLITTLHVSAVENLACCVNLEVIPHGQMIARETRPSSTSY